MKAEPPNAKALPQIERKSVDGRPGGQRRVKGRVETSHRGNAGKVLTEVSRGSERRRLV